RARAAVLAVSAVRAGIHAVAAVPLARAREAELIRRTRHRAARFGAGAVDAELRRSARRRCARGRARGAREARVGLAHLIGGARVRVARIVGAATLEASLPRWAREEVAVALRLALARGRSCLHAREPWIAGHVEARAPASEEHSG